MGEYGGVGLKCDLKIINGKVIDTEKGIAEEKSIYIKDGILIDGSDQYEADFTVNAAGKMVLPGLIDEHVHLNYKNDNIGANADLLCTPMGVTTAVDPGSTGWANFDGLFYNNIIRCKSNIYAYLHVAPYGIAALAGIAESANPQHFNYLEILNKVKRYPDIIRGLKLRMNQKTLGNWGLKPLKRTIEIAEELERDTGKHYLVEVHFDNLPEDVRIADVVGSLRRGDIFLHVFQMRGETIFASDGNVQEAVLKAQRRGVLMDDAHGRMLWSFEHLKRAALTKFYPDIISSDVVHNFEYKEPASCLIFAMNMDLAGGIDPMAILKAVTYTPAKALGLLDRAGTLKNGRPADICIMDLQSCCREYRDWWGGRCLADRIFVPLMTIKDGEIVFRQTFF